MENFAAKISTNEWQLTIMELSDYLLSQVQYVVIKLFKGGMRNILVKEI